jgi:hypothetical protein
MYFAGYLISAVLGIVLLAVAWGCASAAGKNHLSPWWLGAYGSLITAFALLAQTTAPLAAAAAH